MRLGQVRWICRVTVSKEQIEYGQQRYKDLNVDLRFQDYREVNEQFDRVVSIGILEHVGPKNYATFMQVVKRNLKDDGLYLLHTIGTNTRSLGTANRCGHRGRFHS